MSKIMYRGLVLNLEEYSSIEEMINEIKAFGDIRWDKFKLAVPNIQHHTQNVSNIISELLESEIKGERYRKDVFCKCVSGDKQGANFYATRTGQQGLIIEIKADVEKLIIDGRDFLYWAMSKILHDGISSVTLELLQEAFGNKIVDYIKKGKRLTNNQDLIFRFIDYIVMDLDIIDKHINNSVTIKGRYNTNFRSAFGIIGGIPATSISDVLQSCSIGENKPLNILDINHFY